MYKRYLLGLVVLGVIVFAVIIQQIFFPIIWFERDELLGVRLGLSKQDVVTLLAQHGVQDVLPRLTHEVVVNKVDQLGQLSDATGICVNDYSNRTMLRVGFDSDGHTILTHESVHKIVELSGLKNRDELIARLRLMIGQREGLEVFICIPQVKWARITSGNMDNSLEFLFKYDVWLFDIPGSYCGARFQFDNGRLSKIKFRWQLFESP